jgi:hypothetical protein
MKNKLLFLTICLCCNTARPTCAAEEELRVKVHDPNNVDLKRQVGDERKSFAIVCEAFPNAPKRLVQGWYAPFDKADMSNNNHSFSWQYSGEAQAQELKNTIYPFEWTLADIERKSARLPHFILKSGLPKKAAEFINRAFQALTDRKIDAKSFLNSIERELREFFKCVKLSHGSDSNSLVMACRELDKNLYNYSSRCLKNRNLSGEERGVLTEGLAFKLMPYLRNEMTSDMNGNESDLLTCWRIEIIQCQIELLKNANLDVGFPDKSILQYLNERPNVERSTLSVFKLCTHAVFKELQGNKESFYHFVDINNGAAIEKWNKLFACSDEYLNSADGGIRPLIPTDDSNDYRLAALVGLVDILRIAKENNFMAR